MTQKIFNKKHYKERRQKLRNDSTDAEKALWQKLKSKQLGVKFRRQQGVGDYIVDFYCSTLNLVIELDGSQHVEPEALAYDKIRTDYLNSLGITVIRYDNRSVLTNMNGVLADIINYLPEENTN